MKLSNLFIITILSIGVPATPLFGQRIVTGRLMDAETGKYIPKAKITLLNTEIETSTNALGFFQLTIDSIGQILIEASNYSPMQTKLPNDVDNFKIQLVKSSPIEIAIPSPTIPKNVVYTIREDPASFPGGMTKFYDYISKSMRYPKDARNSRITGRVFVEFVIDSTGTIPYDEVKVNKGLYKSCDEEAIRLVRSSPKWNPGMQGEKPVRQKMVLPITFN